MIDLFIAKPQITCEPSVVHRIADDDENKPRDRNAYFREYRKNNRPRIRQIARDSMRRTRAREARA